MTTYTSDNEQSLEPVQASKIKSTLTYAVSDDEISGKKGNFLITVGNPSAGKSTLQNALIYRLWTDKRITFDYANKVDDHEHDAIINRWISNFADGRLPARSEQGILQEFNIRVSQRERPPLQLNFLEISGEDIKSVVPSEGSLTAPTLNAQLERYLKNDNLNKRFVFLSDSTLSRKFGENKGQYREDILFNSLIRYCLADNAIGLSKMKILFVASKWDVVQSEYTSVIEYFNKNFPQTRALVSSSDRIIAQYLPFSIGEVVSSPSGEPKIESLQGRYLDFLIQWIYQSYIGRPLKGYPKLNHNLWDKFKALFA